MMGQMKDRDMILATPTQQPLTGCGSTERNPNPGLGPTSQFQARNSHVTRGYHIEQCRMEHPHYHRTCDCYSADGEREPGQGILGLKGLSRPESPEHPCSAATLALG